MDENDRAVMQSTKLWVALNLAQKTVRQKIETKLKEENLPDLRWFDILFKLANSPEGVRPFELEKALLFEQSNVSRLVRKMVDQGYIVELPFKRDGRGKVLNITMSGDVLVRKIWKVYGAEIHSLMLGVRQEHDPDVFLDALKSLLDEPQLDQFFSGPPEKT